MRFNIEYMLSNGDGFYTLLLELHLPSPLPRYARRKTFLETLAEPRIYYYETVECGRRCLMTGALGKRYFVILYPVGLHSRSGKICRHQKDLDFSIDS